MQVPFDRNAVDIVTLADTPVAVFEYRGHPRLLDRSIGPFIQWRIENHRTRQVSRTFNVLYHDPAQVAPAEFRTDLCATVEGPVAANRFGVVGRTLPGGRCARLRHLGSDATLGAALDYLCGQWLARSGEQRRDFPIVLERVKFAPEVAADQAVTDLFLPLR